uniref:PH domain-containing protein n=1 Tax=Sinocyclocheilus anshuiensis TaxID=1608454 RepID=A0A671KK22_9TELE
VEEVCTGFLIKSPPPRQIKNTKSWKKRYFVLSKTNDSCHELKYYKTTESAKPIKSIQASTITMLQVHPQTNPVFEWICKAFKCSPSSVLFMKAENPGDKVPREFFFIGDNSKDVDSWFNALFGAIKVRHSTFCFEQMIIAFLSRTSVTGTSEDSLLDYVTKTIANFCILVSKCGEIEASSLFHKGDQILAVNDLLTDTVEEVQTYLRKLSKSEVKLTIQRLPGSIPLNSEPC